MGADSMTWLHQQLLNLSVTLTCHSVSKTGQTCCFIVTVLLAYPSTALRAFYYEAAWAPSFFGLLVYGAK